MKTILLIMTLVLNTSFVLAQLTPKWETLNSGMPLIIDSISDENSYMVDQYQISYDKNCLFQLDSNHYFRITSNAFRKFPKDGKYFNQGVYLEQYRNIEFSEDRGRSWKKIYSFQYGIEIKPKVFTDISLDIKYANDSVMFFTGITYESIKNIDSQFIGKLVRTPKPDGTWNFEYMQKWEQTNLVIVDLAMINEMKGYAIYANPQENGKNEIIYTEDGWKTFSTIYRPSEEPVPSFSKLSVCQQDTVTLISFTYDANNMLYLSKDNFKKLQIIDFNPNHKLVQVYAYKPDIIYILTEGKEKAGINTYTARRLHKTTDGGKTWEIIRKSTSDEVIYNFKLFNENNFIFYGIFHPNEPSAKSNFLRTQDSGKSWQFLYGPKIENTDRVINYHYINDNQIIVAKLTNNFEQPYYNDDFSYIRQIIENFNVFSNTAGINISYFQSLVENTLLPPVIKLDDSLTAKHNFGTDTLYWKKVESATKYRISFYGVADASITYGIGSTNYWTYTRMTTERIDTVVTDTFLIMNNLKRNYKYEIWATAENNSKTSEFAFLLTSCKEKPKMDYPIIYYPVRDDTIPYGKVTFSWKKVKNADSYNITLFEFDRSEMDSTHGIGFNFDTRYLLIERNYPENSLIYNDLLPNSMYFITVSAMNKDEITDYYWIGFSTGNYPSVVQDDFDIRSTTIFPNPASDYITLNVPPFEKRGLGGVLLPIQIYNIFGECVLTFETVLRPVSTKIDISSLPAGVYFLKIGTEKPKKFVKM